jgi:hypothetical protein
MSNKKYLSATMTVDRSPEEVFEAVADVRGWWSENIVGGTTDLGDEFVFSDDAKYAGEMALTAKEGIRFCRFHLTEVVPGKRMVWHVLDSVLTFIDDTNEWTDTHVVFDITPTPGGATLEFTHEGLTEESECFEACSRGWGFYITQSLPQLITTGTGKPIRRY